MCRPITEKQEVQYDKGENQPRIDCMSRDALNALIKTTRTVARKSSRETDERLAEYSKVHAACN